MLAFVIGHGTDCFPQVVFAVHPAGDAGQETKARKYRVAGDTVSGI